MENEYSSVKLLRAASEEKPSDFEMNFNNLMLDKIRDAVRERKIEVAKNMYNYKPIEKVEYDEVEDV